MHWVLQDNLINPDTRDQVVRLLAQRGTACTRVKLIPIFNELDGEPPELTGPVFVYGSTSLGHVARARGWSPGYFDENLDYELMLAKYGDLALNAGAVCSTLAEMTQQFDRFFLRPTLDAKSFAGTVMTWDEFEAFRSGVASVADVPDATLRLSDRIVAAPLTEIAAEYRFFVIARRVVTGSRYKLGDQVKSVPEVPPEVASFAQACVDLWSPNDAFAIDVAVTPAGLKVIEVNSANSAGFYACDVGKLVDAVNERLS
jgi:hypothetical protein